MIRIYTASKLQHAAFWRDMQKHWHWAFFHARWLRHNEIGTPDTPEHAVHFWQEDEEDVRNADLVIVYAVPGDHLRGALVEAGIALANGVPVMVVGEHSDYGTWQYHPGVIRVPDWIEAAKYTREMAER